MLHRLESVPASQPAAAAAASSGMPSPPSPALSPTHKALPSPTLSPLNVKVGLRPDDWLRRSHPSNPNPNPNPSPNPDPNPDPNPNPNPNQADLFVLTSLYENFCMAAHEATFFGLPLLAYDVGEIASFRAHLGSVLLPVGDEAGFSAELARLLREP